MEYLFRFLELFLDVSIICVLLRFRREFLQKCSIHLDVPHGFILDPTVFLAYIYDLPNDVTWDKVKSGPSKICGRQLLKSLK